MLASFFGGIDDAVFAIQPKSVSEPEQVTMNAVGDGNIDGHSEPTSPHVSASKTGNVFSDALCSPLTSDGKPKPTSRRGSSFRYGGMRETPLATNSASFLSKSPTTASIPEALSISCDKERSPAEKALSCRAIHELATFDEGDDTHNAFDLRSSGLSSKGKDKDGLDVALRNTDLSGFASNPSSTKRPFENSLSLSCSDRRSSTSTHTTYASTCSGSGSGSSSESTINNNANIQGTYGSIDVPTSVTTIGTTSVSDACPAPTFPALFSDLFFHADLDACSSETETGIALGMVDGTDIAVADATENCHADAITALAPAAVSTATDLSITPSNPYMTDTNDISSPTTDAPVNGSALTPVVASADAPVVHAHIDAPVVASDSNADIPVNDHNNSSTPTINATINAIVSHGAVSPTSPGNNALSAKARAKKALDKWEKEREADKRRAIERIKEQKREASMRKLNVAASAATLFSVMVDAELHLAMAMDRWREILEREEVAKKTHRTGSIESILRLFSGIPSPKVLPNKQSFSDKNMQDPSSYLDLDADETPRMPSSDSIISLELKVLLFDKPSKDMKYLVNWLASMGCLVVIADTPKLALSCLKHESFDIAFIDLMPVSQKYQRELQRHRGSRQMIDRWMNWQMPLPEHIAAMANTDDETMVSSTFILKSSVFIFGLRYRHYFMLVLFTSLHLYRLYLC